MKTLLAALGLAAALMAGAAPAQAANKTADKLTVILDWLVNPDHMPLVYAKETGIFEKYGLDVDLVPPSDAATPAKIVAAGQADLAIGYEPNLLLDVDAGLPLTRIATLIGMPLNCIIAKADSGIKSMADLKGRKVGFSVAGFDDGILGPMLENAGLKKTDVTMINVNFALVPALLSGQVDAVIGGYRNVEAVQLKSEGVTPVVLPVEENGVPPYDELIVEANKAKLDDPRLPRFVAALEEATLRITNHPDEAWAVFAKAHPDLDDAFDKASWRATMPVFAKRPAAFDAGRYERYAAFLHAQGLIKTVRPASDYGVTVY